MSGRMIYSDYLGLVLDSVTGLWSLPCSAITQSLDSSVQWQTGLIIFKVNLQTWFCAPGGRFLEVGDEKCTHLVVEENSIKELPFVPSKRLYVVKQEVSLRSGLTTHPEQQDEFNHFIFLYTGTCDLFGFLSKNASCTVCVCVYKWVEQCGLGSSNLLVLYFLPFLSFKWFWGSIQMDARAGESMYSYEKVTQRTCKKVVYHLYFRYNILNIIQLTISSDSYCYLLYFCFMCLMQIFI